MSTTDTIIDLLTEARIPWNRIVALGGDIDTIRREAIAAGDTELARRATRRLRTRAT
jgi:hypothetical protein